MFTSSLCPLIFSHGHIRPNGEIYPCCYFNPSALPKDLNINNPDWFNHPYLETLRELSRKNKFIQGCAKCYVDEKNLKISLRTDKLRFYERLTETEYTAPEKAELKSLDLAFSNLCNNKCRMCTPKLSTYWYPDAMKLGIPFEKGIIDISDYLEITDFSNLINVKIVGGESMLEQEKFKKFLTKCNRSNLTVEIVTNCTTLPDAELVKLLKECKAVYWILSVDAYKDLNNYLRNGSDWDTVVDSIDYYVNNWPLVEIYSVVSIYNVNLLHQLPDFILNKYTNNTPLLTCAMIDGPGWMTLKHIPEFAKDILLDRIETTHNDIIRDWWSGIIKAQLTIKGNPDIFLKHSEPLDQIRKEKLQDVNPELASWFEQYKNSYPSA